MIHLTGDIHGLSGAHRLFYGYDPYLHKIKEGDYLIVLGDFGLVWNQKENLNEKYFLDEINKRPWVTLFIEGNHENFDRLWSDEFETIEFGGHCAKKIRDKILYLQRSCIYEIEGKKIFTMGGGTSVDKMYRTEGITWWKEEIPAYADLVEARANLSKHNYEVDYIITHSCDERSLYYPPIVNRSNKRGKTQEENKLFNEYENNVKYKHWYFGHYHVDGSVNERKTVVYEKVLKID